jgi:hypothetical protein
LNSTFIRSGEDDERHLEVGPAMSKRRQVDDRFPAPTPKLDTDIKALIGRNLDAVGRTEDTVLTVFTDG